MTSFPGSRQALKCFKNATECQNEFYREKKYSVSLKKGCKTGLTVFPLLLLHFGCLVFSLSRRWKSQNSQLRTRRLVFSNIGTTVGFGHAVLDGKCYEIDSRMRLVANFKHWCTSSAGWGRVRPHMHMGVLPLLTGEQSWHPIAKLKSYLSLPTTISNCHVTPPRVAKLPCHGTPPRKSPRFYPPPPSPSTDLVLLWAR